MTISGVALETNPTTMVCIGGQFLTPITLTTASLGTTFMLSFTQTDTFGNTSESVNYNMTYRVDSTSGG